MPNAPSNQTEFRPVHRTFNMQNILQHHAALDRDHFHKPNKFWLELLFWD
jgi:hypothetical protein